MQLRDNVLVTFGERFDRDLVLKCVCSVAIKELIGGTKNFRGKKEVVKEIVWLSFL